MCMLFNISPGPPIETQLSVRTPLEPIKGRVRMLEHKVLWNSLKLSTDSQAIQHTVDVRFYAPAARTTLNPCVLSVIFRLLI
jgi:hypothetical protein